MTVKRVRILPGPLQGAAAGPREDAQAAGPPAPPPADVLSAAEGLDARATLEVPPTLEVPEARLVPGEAAPLHRLALPRGVRGHARESVARRQLQDIAALDPEAMDLRPFAAGAEGAEWSRLLVASAADVARWRAQVGRDTRPLLPDYLALPAAEAVWTLREEGGRLLARLGPADGFAAEAPLGRLMLERALADGPPRAVVALGPLDPATRAPLEAAALPFLAAPEAAAGLGLAVPRRFAHGELALDLRRDPQRARDRLRRRLLPWRWPALAGLLAAALWSAALWTETERLGQSSGAYRSATERLVREELVPDGPLLDIRAQVSRVLAARRAAAMAAEGGADPLILLATAADVLTEQRAEVALLDFLAGPGLTVELSVADFEALDRLVAALAAGGLVVSLQESRSAEAGEGVRVLMTLRPGDG